MALDMNDLMMLRGMDQKTALSPYEQVKLDHMTAKSHTGGVAVAGLVTGVVGVVAGATAWIFGGMQASAKGKEAKEAAQSAKELAMAYYTGVDKRIDNIGALLESEVTRRINGDQTITQTITDTISGQQSTAQSQSTVAENSAYASAMNQIVSDRLTGRSSLDAQPVMIYSAPQPCACPGCGCNG